MFTIRKKYIIQIFSIGPEVVHTSEVDSLRKKDYVDTARGEIRAIIDSILSLTPTESLEKGIDKYFPKKMKTKKLNNFLHRHPHVFYDLIRILHKHRVNDSSKGWYIPNEYIREIEQVFIFRDRPEDIGNLIPDFVSSILGNNSFIEYASKQVSVLDVSAYDFSLIPGKHRTSLIKRLLIIGLISNIPGCTEKNVEGSFATVKSEIFAYLTTIYGTDLNTIVWVQKIEQLVTQLNALFELKTGNHREKAWKVIQAFYAWGDISTRQGRYAQLKSSPNAIPDLLKINSIDIDSQKIKSETNILGVEKSTVEWEYKGYTIKILWRLKTPKSMSKKSWEKEEYVNASSIRDECGISFVYPDNMPEPIVLELIRIGGALMADRGYILENKGGITATAFEELIKDPGKVPLTYMSKPGKNPNMRNINQSGFMRLGRGKSRYAVGCEIQYMCASAAEWKEREDSIYKFNGVIDAIMRGRDEASPKQVFDNITREIAEDRIGELCDPDSSETLGLVTYNDLLLYLIKIGIILPYRGVTTTGKSVCLFTTNKYEDRFNKKWNMSLINPSMNMEWQELSVLVVGLTQTH